MKKNLLLLLLIATTSVAVAKPQSWQCGFPKLADVIVTLDDNGVMTISGSGKMKFISWINPDERPWRNSHVKTLVVQDGITDIGSALLYGCNTLTSVTISNSVTEIGSFAFLECSNLTSITIPNSVTKIGASAFSESGLTSIVIPNSVIEIEYGAFSNCKELTSVTLPKNLKKLANITFSLSGLTSVVIPYGITEIGNMTFFACYNLTSVSIPSSVRTIGKEAFSNCKNLSSVNISLEHTKIADDAFKGSGFNPNEVNKSFTYFAKKYVEDKVNEWQKKGKFETTDQWQQRVNESTRKAKIDEFTKLASADFIEEKSKEVNLSLKLSDYDADNGVFLVKSSVNDLLVPVPLTEAEAFENAWANIDKTPKYTIANDKLALAEVSFKLPNGKTYQYSNQASLNYAQAKIDYNFAPIEISVADNTHAPKGKQNITTTNVTVGKADVALNIPVTNIKNDKTFAVIISNENYQEAGVSQVEFAINDGAVFKEYCIKTLGIPETNVSHRSNATLNNMRAEINWLRQIAEKFNGEANLIFYYAGHGIPDDNSKTSYLLPVDGYGTDVATAYKLDDLYQTLGKIPAKSVTVFMDACFSGAQRSGNMMASARGVAIKAVQGKPKGNMVVFSAAQGDETAYPYKEKEHGLFTYFLLKKLQETNGDVTLGELSEYITTQVRQQSIVVNRKSQTPTVTASDILTNVWKGLKLK